MAVRFEDARDAIGVLPGCGDLRCTLGIEQVVRGSSAMWCSLPRRASISPRWGDSQCGPGEERLHAGGWKVMTELPNQVKRPLNRDSVMPGTAPAAPHRTVDAVAAASPCPCSVRGLPRAGPQQRAGAAAQLRSRAPGRAWPGPAAGAKGRDAGAGGGPPRRSPSPGCGLAGPRRSRRPPTRAGSPAP